MRLLTPAMQALWESGGPFIGANRANGAVLIEPTWGVNESMAETAANTAWLPFRWWQRAANDQTMVELPNVKSVSWDRRIDADAGECTIVLYNQWHFANTSPAHLPGTLGDPGHFTWRHGDPRSAARWGQTLNDWANRLIPNALLRVYEGYGGHNKTTAQAIADGDLVISMTCLIDTVRVTTDGLLELSCRDVGKLLVEQQLYKPLIPASYYPASFCRWKYNPTSFAGTTAYDYTNPTQSGPGAEGPKYITDITMNADGDGYWLVGTDGGVFSFGVPFHGSRGSDTDAGPMMAIAADPELSGYWLASRAGGVYAFGDVGFYGSVSSPPSPISGMAAKADGRGYWLVAQNGTVYNFGSAVYYGGNPAGAAPIVAIEATPTGLGYYLLSNTAQVYAYGDAVWHGNGALTGLEFVARMAVSPTADGYWIAYDSGRVGAFGAVTVKRPGPGWYGDAGEPFGANGAPAGVDLNDPIMNITATPTGNGYLLVGGDGGVFNFGDAAFWGSLPGAFTYQTRLNADYLDYTDVVEVLLLWAGWLLYGSGTGAVHGILETTGAYADECLPPDMFDKRPVIDPINQIRETVGYIFYIGEAGEAHFVSPNWYVYGSLLPNRTRSTNVVQLTDTVQITDFTVEYNDRNLRSQITIASHDPDQGLANLVAVTRSIASPLLRGMCRPAMWVNEHLTKRVEMDAMADLMAHHIQRSLLEGTVKIFGTPAIQIDDQVRIFERVSSETSLNYVRGIASDHDFDSGRWEMTLTVNPLADITP